MQRYSLQPEWQRFNYSERHLFSPYCIYYNHGLNYGRYKKGGSMADVYERAARDLDLSIRYLRLLEKHSHVRILASWNERMEAGCVVYINLTREGARCTDNLERGCRMVWNEDRTKKVRHYYISLGGGCYKIDNHFDVISCFNEAALEMDIASHNRSNREWMWKKYKELNPKTNIPNPNDTSKDPWSGRLTNQFVYHKDKKY